MYCRACHYSLTGLAEPRCPECATAFNPANPDTFLPALPTRASIGFRTAVWLATPLLATIVWLHVLLNAFGDAFDTILFVVASALKIATLISLVALLLRVQRQLADRSRAPLATFATLGACLVAAVALLAAVREPIIIRHLNDSAVSYYGTSSTQPWLVGYVNEWGPRWRRGQIFAEEAGLAVALAGAYVMIGRTRGRRRGPTVLLTLVATAVLLLTQYFVFELWVIDWDNFHGDIYSGALTLDLLFFPIAADPYTPIASVMYLGLWTGCAITLRRAATREG